MESVYIALVVVILTIFLSAFFSGMEIAFLNKNRLKLEIDRKQSRLFDYLAGLFSRHQGEYITTILVGNNIVLVIYTMCLSMLLRKVAVLLGWESVSEWSIIIETIIPTIIILFLGEYLPKSMMRNNPNFYYRIFAPIIYLFYIILYPISRFTTLLSYLLLRIMGTRVESREEPTEFNRDDLASLVEADNLEVDKEDEEDIRLFQNALDFADLHTHL